MRQKLLTLALALGTSIWASAESAMWLRYQRISPDGKTIAFSYQGDIYTVGVKGGNATRITSHAAYDFAPVWSPDSKHIAFSSDREGSDDVYIVSAGGGVAKRLTFNSGREIPQAFTPEGDILFSGNTLPTRLFDQHPSPMMAQLYSISVKGGRPQLVSALTMLEPSYTERGEMLYTDLKGYEDAFRKHHTSSIARDIWFRDNKGKFTKLTDFTGEDRNAVYDGKSGFYYLSEQDGTFNVYHRASLSPQGKDKKLTNFKGNPVRFLSRSLDGVLCFGYDGGIYTLIDGEKPRRVNVNIVSDFEVPERVMHQLLSGARSYAVTSKGDEYAVVVGGDVFVVNSEFGTSRRITNTPEEERGVTFAPDGRTLIYDSQRSGQWQLYKSEIVRKEDKQFVYAKEIKETQLTSDKKACFQPVFNPKGDEVAFLRDRNELAVLNLKSNKIRTIVPTGINFSYADGDQHFEWSQSGKYLLSHYQGNGGWNNTDCALYKADGSGLEINLTQSGYSDRNGRFALKDKAVIFLSDRNGYRSHGSWGATTDVYIMFLENKAYSEFLMNKEDRALAKAEKAEKDKQEAEAKAKAKKKDDSKSDKKGDKKSDKKDNSSKQDSTAKPKEEDIKFNFDERDRRTVRITRFSGSISDAVMNADGTKLYYIARYGQDNELWEYNLEDRSNRMLTAKVSGTFVTSADGKKIYIQSPNALQEVGGKSYNFRVEQEFNPALVTKGIFEDVYVTIRDKFYDVKLHGVDWDGYHKTYAKFLPSVTHTRDLADLMSEMLGELNVSHTGAQAIRTGASATPTAALGAFYDLNYKGNGLLIEEILIGSPLLHTDTEISAGMIIEKVNGEEILSEKPLEYYFNGKVGKRTILTIKPKTGKSFEVAVKPISLSAQGELLYERWLKKREELVREWSGGKVGYVYVRNMNSPSFRSVFKDLLGKYKGCESVIVDTRYNGGGWLHEDLVVLLGGKKFSTFTPRGQYAGDDPFMQWNKPSCVLMNEGNYSNGHGFPWAYKQLGLGKLVGTPVPGTMTAVWWKVTHTGSIVYGIPEVTVSDLQGKALENQQLYPDVEVYNSPEDYLSGYDRQLKAAVDLMLKGK